MNLWQERYQLCRLQVNPFGVWLTVRVQCFDRLTTETSTCSFIPIIPKESIPSICPFWGSQVKINRFAESGHESHRIRFHRINFPVSPKKKKDTLQCCRMMRPLFPIFPSESWLHRRARKGKKGMVAPQSKIVIVIRLVIPSNIFKCHACICAHVHAYFMVWWCLAMAIGTFKIILYSSTIEAHKSSRAFYSCSFASPILKQSTFGQTRFN